MGHLVKNCEPPPGPSLECLDCADCDGGPGSTAILTVSGLTGVCLDRNGVYLLNRSETCTWSGFKPAGPPTLEAFVRCFGLEGEEIWSVLVNLAFCSTCPLSCPLGGDHPTGSGPLTGFGSCVGQTGSFTLT